jgi:hypothetical protein
MPNTSNINLFKKFNSFTDISLSFEPNAVTKDLTVIKNERAINNSIKNIIMMVPGEVPFQQDIGSQVTNYLFDIIDNGTAGFLTLEIKRTINYNEPRVKLMDVIVQPQPDLNQFVCNITYKIVGYEQTFRVDQILRPTL